MENVLLIIFYFIQSFFNLLVTLEVVPGVSIAGILISILIIIMIFKGLGLYADRKK